MSLKDTNFTYIPGRRPELVTVYTGGQCPGGQRLGRRRRSISKDCGMTSVRWSDDRYDVSALLRSRDSQFPAIVKVTRGYCSESPGDGFGLSVGQILQIYGARDQTRIKATDADGQTLSVPFDFHMTVRAQTTTSCRLGPVQQLSEFVKDSAKLPVTVHVESVDPNNNGQMGRQLESKLVNTQLTIDSVYQSKFLVANPIQNGWLNSADVIIIPEDLRAEFCLAVGLHGANTEEWTDYCGMFARAARRLRLDNVTGYQGVFYMSWSNNSRPSVMSSPVDESANPDKELNVQHYFLSRGSRRQPPDYDSIHHRHQQQHLSSHHHLRTSSLGPRQRNSATFQSLDSLELVGSATNQTSPALPSFGRDTVVQSSWSQSKSSRRPQTSAVGADQLSMLPLKDLSQHHSSSGKRRSSNVAETSLNYPVGDIAQLTVVDNPTSTTGSSRDIAGPGNFPVEPSAVTTSHVQPQPPQLMTSFPQTNYPRMGKRCAVPIGHRKASCLSDVTDAALGGSMPCLLTDSNVVAAGSHQQQLSTLSASAADVESNSRTPNVVIARSRVTFQVGTVDTTTSEGDFSVDDGYCTKDSSTSMSSSGEQSLVRAPRRPRDVSPVFF